jgi:hypothetical protein
MFIDEETINLKKQKKIDVINKDISNWNIDKKDLLP